MIQSAMSPSLRNYSLLLVCAMLGACATTQKSSSGSGEQAAAPISEPATQQSAAKPGTAPASSSASSANSPSQSSNAAKSAGAAAASGNAGAKQGSQEGAAVAAGSEEEAQLKRQLADQDAEINRLRNEQQAIAEREEAEAAKVREQQAAATAAASEASASAAGSTATGSKGQDEAVVFPPNSNANAGKAPASSAENSDSAAPPATIERSVYFAYDQAVVAEKYDGMLVANAAWLKAHPTAKSEVQGNCDERGSREYNLALGARRAQAVKRALELAGADGNRIAAVSFGAEKPVATGKDEASYSLNRRADIVY